MTALGYIWDNGEYLSAIGDDSTVTVSERSPHILLRPVFINAVEVGYAYSPMDKDRRLHVRGITIAIWYFLARGHQVVALLPHCFKIYPDKSSNWQELMTLFKMNLVEFTPGFGADKYIEVNRILASHARETGGCIVARSQMHAIVEESPQLDRTVEKRLLMPAFNGDDLIFPMDGPLGRIGPTLSSTLRCEPTDPEWGRVSHHQLLLRDQRIWLGKMIAISPEKVAWATLSAKMDSFQPKTVIKMDGLPDRPPASSVHKVLPPESNPPDGRGFSHERRAMRRNGHDVYYFPRVDQPQQASLPPNIRNVDELFLPGYVGAGGLKNAEPNIQPLNLHRCSMNNLDSGNHSGAQQPTCPSQTCCSMRHFGMAGRGPREKEFLQFTSAQCLVSHKYYCENRINLHQELAEIFYAKQFDQECPKSAKIDPDNGTWRNCLPENNSALRPIWIRCTRPDRCNTVAVEFRLRHRRRVLTQAAVGAVAGINRMPNNYESPMNNRYQPNRAQPFYERRYDHRSEGYVERLPQWTPYQSTQNFRAVPHTDVSSFDVPSDPMSPTAPSAAMAMAQEQAPRIELSSNTEANREANTREIFSKVAAILGWEMAKEVTEKFPGVSSVALLIEYALDGPPNASQSENRGNVPERGANPQSILPQTAISAMSLHDPHTQRMPVVSQAPVPSPTPSPTPTPPTLVRSDDATRTPAEAPQTRNNLISDRSNDDGSERVTVPTEVRRRLSVQEMFGREWERISTRNKTRSTQEKELRTVAVSTGDPNLREDFLSLIQRNKPAPSMSLTSYHTAIALDVEETPVLQASSREGALLEVDLIEF